MHAGIPLLPWIGYSLWLNLLGSYVKPFGHKRTYEVFVNKAKRRITSHLLLTSDQKPSVNAHGYLCRLEILVPQFLVTSLFERL